MMEIQKSLGFTPTEKLLSELCDQTFLKLWSYANPKKEDGKELCDLLAVFENHIFIFFDRENLIFHTSNKDEIDLLWKRWKKDAIDKQIKTSQGAEKYILRSSPIYLDAKQKDRFPIKIPNDPHIHKIIVAHGASEACKKYSDSNIYGSLGIFYGDILSDHSSPFTVHLDKNDPAHIFDSHNLGIILGELDTFFDFKAYLTAKENVIKELDCLAYSGEEDLLAHYLSNYDKDGRRHFIGTKDKTINGVFIGEGEWKDFHESERYKLKKAADQISYNWDNLIQMTCQNALGGTLIGDSDIFNGQSAIFEMAMEPRLSRRILSKHLIAAIHDFPDNLGPSARKISVMMESIYEDKGYVFLQVRNDDIADYDEKHRPFRQHMLKVACGVVKNKFPHLKKIIGIAMDAPKFTDKNSEDFLLLNCEHWTKEDRKYFEEENEIFNFLQTPDLNKQVGRTFEFPDASKITTKLAKIGRNEKCPCGSGKKYKKCCWN